MSSKELQKRSPDNQTARAQKATRESAQAEGGKGGELRDRCNPENNHFESPINKQRSDASGAHLKASQSGKSVRQPSAASAKQSVSPGGVPTASDSEQPRAGPRRTARESKPSTRLQQDYVSTTISSGRQLTSQTRSRDFSGAVAQMKISEVEPVSVRRQATSNSNSASNRSVQGQPKKAGLPPVRKQPSAAAVSSASARLQ